MDGAIEKMAASWSKFIEEIKKQTRDLKLDLIADEDIRRQAEALNRVQGQVDKIFDDYIAKMMENQKIASEDKFLDANVGIEAAKESIKAALGAISARQEPGEVIKLPDKDVMALLITMMDTFKVRTLDIGDAVRINSLEFKKAGFEIEAALAKQNLQYDIQLAKEREIKKIETEIALLRVPRGRRTQEREDDIRRKGKQDELEVEKEISLEQLERDKSSAEAASAMAILLGHKQEELTVAAELLRIERDIAVIKKEPITVIDKLNHDLKDAQKRVNDFGRTFVFWVSLWSDSAVGVQFNKDISNSLHGASRSFQDFFDEVDKRIKDTYTQGAELARTTAESMRSAFTDIFFDGMRGDLKKFRDYWNEFLSAIERRLADTLADMVMSSSIMKSLGQGISAVLGLSRGVIPSSELAASVNIPGQANGGIFEGGFVPFKAYAGGGIADSPTLGLVGEGRYNEAIVPLPDGRSIPVQMKNNKGSGSVVVVNNYQINAIDTKSWADHVRRNGGPILEVINNDIRRNGATRSMMRSRL